MAQVQVWCLPTIISFQEIADWHVRNPRGWLVIIDDMADTEEIYHTTAHTLVICMPLSREQRLRQQEFSFPPVGGKTGRLGDPGEFMKVFARGRHVGVLSSLSR